MGQERRQFIRVNMRLVTFMKVLETGKVRRTLTKDISGTGLCLVTEDVLKPETQLEIEMKLPDFASAMTFTAQVVWSKAIPGTYKSYEFPGAETGVRVVKIDPKHAALIRQYAAVNAPPAV